MGWTRFTRVPFRPAARPILKIPPSRAARSRMPSSPIDLVLRACEREIAPAIVLHFQGDFGIGLSSDRTPT